MSISSSMSTITLPRATSNDSFSSISSSFSISHTSKTVNTAPLTTAVVSVFDLFKSQPKLSLPMERFTKSLKSRKGSPTEPPIGLSRELEDNPISLTSSIHTIATRSHTSVSSGSLKEEDFLDLESSLSQEEELLSLKLWKELQFEMEFSDSNQR